MNEVCQSFFRSCGVGTADSLRQIKEVFARVLQLGNKVIAVMPTVAWISMALNLASLARKS